MEVQWTTLSGEVISRSFRRTSSIADVAACAGLLNRKKVEIESSDAQVAVMVLYPGTAVEVPVALGLSALWDGRFDDWFTAHVIDIRKIRDDKRVLHFDVLFGSGIRGGGVGDNGAGRTKSRKR